MSFQLVNLSLAPLEFVPDFFESLFNILLECLQLDGHALQLLCLLILEVIRVIGGCFIGELPSKVLLLPQWNEL